MRGGEPKRPTQSKYRGPQVLVTLAISRGPCTRQLNKNTGQLARVMEQMRYRGQGLQPRDRKGNFELRKIDIPWLRGGSVVLGRRSVRRVDPPEDASTGKN